MLNWLLAGSGDTTLLLLPLWLKLCMEDGLDEDRVESGGCRRRDEEEKLGWCRLPSLVKRRVKMGSKMKRRRFG